MRDWCRAEQAGCLRKTRDLWALVKGAPISGGPTFFPQKGRESPGPGCFLPFPLVHRAAAIQRGLPADGQVVRTGPSTVVPSTSPRALTRAWSRAHVHDPLTLRDEGPCVSRGRGAGWPPIPAVTLADEAPSPRDGGACLPWGQQTLRAVDWLRNRTETPHLCVDPGCVPDTDPCILDCSSLNRGLPSEALAPRWYLV